MSSERKERFVQKVKDLLSQHPRILFVGCDHIGSNHMQRIRVALRGKGVLLMGKNTMIRFAVKQLIEDGQTQFEGILGATKGNTGMIFTHEDLSVIQDILDELTVPAAAKSGIAAPSEVKLEPHVTQLDPQKTQFFAALDIATRITRGCVEILTGRILCKKGEKVGSSEAALLQMLNIKPFEYGMIPQHVYDTGSVYSAHLLAMTEADLFGIVAQGVSEIAALSLAISYPTLPAFPHVIANNFKNLLAVALMTDYVFEQAEKIKERVENPEAFAAASPAAAAEETKQEEEEEEEEEEESEGFGDDLFGF